MSISTRPILFRQTNVDTHTSPAPVFNVGDLVLCRYATYPYWPARVDRTHQSQYQNAYQTQRRNKKGTIVNVYWCMFINDNCGGWVQVNRIVKYDIHLSSQIRLSPQHRFYQDQKKALDAADMIFKHSRISNQPQHLSLSTPDIDHYLANKHLFFADEDDLESDIEARKENTNEPLNEIIVPKETHNTHQQHIKHDPSMYSCSEDDIPLIDFVIAGQKRKRQRMEEKLKTNKGTRKNTKKDMQHKLDEQKMELKKSQETILNLRQEIRKLKTDLDQLQTANKNIEKCPEKVQNVLQIDVNGMTKDIKSKRIITADCMEESTTNVDVSMEKTTTSQLGQGAQNIKTTGCMEEGKTNANVCVEKTITSQLGQGAQNIKTAGCMEESKTNANVCVEKKSTSQLGQGRQNIKKFRSPFQPTSLKKKYRFASYHGNAKVGNITESGNGINTDASCKMVEDKVNESTSQVESNELVKTKQNLNMSKKEDGAETIPTTIKHHLGGIAAAAALFKIVEKIKEHAEGISSSAPNLEEARIDHSGQVHDEYKVGLSEMKEQENVDGSDNCTPNVAVHFANTTFNMHF